MEEYKGIINKLVKELYESILVIDIIDDKLYKYYYKDSDFICDSELSYSEYLNSCDSVILEKDLDKYIDSLSISKLESLGGKSAINYSKKDEVDTYREYHNDILLYDKDGKKIIIVLVSKVLNGTSFKDDNSSKSNIESKLNKLVDSVGLAILKIHNIVNDESNSLTKREYIDSILAGLTNDFPEFNKALNDNAMNLYDNGKKTIMIIDDDKTTCSLIKKIFDKDYDVIVANDGQEAIDCLGDVSKDSSFKNSISCIFLDLLMPVLDGFSVLDYLNDNNFLEKIPVIIISGNYDKETRNRAYTYQIADMLEKPFNVQVVRHRIENLINLYQSSNSLNNVITDQHKDLKSVINSLIVSYEFDNQIRMEMIKKYTHILALQVSIQYPEYNISSNMIDKLANSAGYYAIGNYTIPKSILYKKGVYTEDERSIVKMASVNGANIIKYVLGKNNSDIDSKYCYEIVKYHNERYDGNGYPEGLSANSIPLSVQIASIAIEYSNLINSITPVDFEKVASLIIMESGRKFNPKIVESFKKVQDEFEQYTKVGG